jgi:hypothetical protein
LAGEQHVALRVHRRGVSAAAVHGDEGLGDIDEAGGDQVREPPPRPAVDARVGAAVGDAFDATSRCRVQVAQEPVERRWAGVGDGARDPRRRTRRVQPQRLALELGEAAEALQLGQVGVGLAALPGLELALRAGAPGSGSRSAEPAGRTSAIAARTSTSTPVAAASSGSGVTRTGAWSAPSASSTPSTTS